MKGGWCIKKRQGEEKRGREKRKRCREKKGERGQGTH